MNLDKQVEELLEKLEFFRMDYAETRDSIYIIFESNQMKVSKKNGKTNNESFPTIGMILEVLRGW